VVVDEVPLEVLDLVVVQDHLGELTDAGVHAVHDLVGHDLLFQHGAALDDALHRLGVDGDLGAVPGHVDQLFDGEAVSVQNDISHGDSSAGPLMPDDRLNLLVSRDRPRRRHRKTDERKII